VKFALFYEIPVPRPWTPDQEHQAYQHTLEQAILGDRVGFHAFWTVEHHFLEEYSHCSNPEVLYGAVAARTERIRIGYGVRLLPKPYNHPIHIVSAWTEDEYQAKGEYWQMGAPRRILPKPLQKPHPPIFGATSSLDGHKEVGKQGIGLCSFTVGLPPEELIKNIGAYREGLSECAQPVGKFKNETAATFTMVHCGPTKQDAYETAARSFEWYPKHGGGLIASVAEWLEERKQDLGTYQYAAGPLQHRRDGALEHLNFDYIHGVGAGVVGDPDECVETCRRYEAAGCDLLLCLVNPYDIPHEKVMESIELFGKHVIPEFDKEKAATAG